MWLCVQVLTFKQVTWQTLRIEADASESCEDAPSTPLRLLTNGGKLNVALKRRVSRKAKPNVSNVSYHPQQ